MRGVAPLFLLAAVLLTTGCNPDFDTRPDPPPPSAEVTLTADGGYRLDGRVVTSEALDRELRKRAADAPNEKLSRTRLHVVVLHAPGVSYDRVMEMQERCQRLGISQVEVPR